MAASKVLMEVSARSIATLTLNRPDVGNACDPETLGLLAGLLDRAAADPAVRVIVLRGAGRHFCSGADVRGQDEAVRPSLSFFDVCEKLDRVAKPTIAVVHGGCIGGGVALAACCDVVLAADDAFFALPEVRLGVAPGALALYFLRALGPRSLRRYLLSGERFSAVVAQQLGLIHAVHPMDALEAALDEIVDAMMLGAPAAQARAKAMIVQHDCAAMTAEAARAMQASFDQHVMDDEAKEGRASFREKRKPSWYPIEKS
jgi:methylglutaconyl-CoA hydratase